MLEVEHLSVVYGQHRALNEVFVKIAKGEVVVILGANGAGKSSLLRAIAGSSSGHCEGSITFDGVKLLGLTPDDIVAKGIALVPEGRAIFGDLNVEENLKLGAYNARARANEAENLDRVLTLFPILRNRRKQITRSMSGGEQQMVAIGRALMSDPSILMLDEPSLGLSPILSKELFHALSSIRETGLGILVVEQNAKLSLSIADRGYLIENGHIVGENDAANLSADHTVQNAYLGVTTNAVAPDIRLTSSPKTAGAFSDGHSGRTFFTPNVPSPGAHDARELIDESLDDLICRASDVAQQRLKKSGESKKVNINAAQEQIGPPSIELRSHPLRESSPQKSEQQELRNGDQHIANMLAEFEEAADRARNWHSNDHQQKYENTQPFTPETSADLPNIPVFRKSRVKIFKRDKAGALVKSKEV